MVWTQGMFQKLTWGGLGPQLMARVREVIGSIHLPHSSAAVSHGGFVKSREPRSSKMSSSMLVVVTVNSATFVSFFVY